MDKKKIISTIKRVNCILSIVKVSFDDCLEIIDCGKSLKEVIKELKKSEWVSVDDELPEYDENVLVCSDVEPIEVWIDSRDKHLINIYNGFRHNSLYGNVITHWKSIEKLEE